MLLLKDEHDVIHNFMLVDAHTHISINQLEGLVPSEFIKRYSKIVRDIAFDIKENESEFRFSFPWDLDDGQPNYYDFCQKDVFSIFHPGEDLIGSLNRFIGFDFIITFSANLKSPLPRDYRILNSKVREALVEKSKGDGSPHNNLRFIGFGRLDPNHSDALDAFDNVFQLGHRGLKLHPKEENFVIDEDETKIILKRAAYYNLPVIFHTQEGMAAMVAELVDNTVKDFIDEGNLDMIPKLKVILGHAPWNGVGNEDLYRILSHPNIFGELSTLKSESYDDFFSNSKSKIRYERIFEMKHLSELDRERMEGLYFNAFGYNRFNYWSSKLLFGSDSPYPPSQGTAQLLKHLFSTKFMGNTSDIQNILGVSALKLIPTIAKRQARLKKEKTSQSKSYHPKRLEMLKKGSKTLGIDPLLEVFPKVRVSGAVFSFLKDRDTQSWLFKSLLDVKDPENIVVLNPYDLSTSSVLTGKFSPVQMMETSLVEE